MKFIYCLNPEVALDLENAGLKKLGETIINGKVVPYFENSKTVYLSRYAKAELLLSNQLFFAQEE
jgi:hypothetical protein